MSKGLYEVWTYCGPPDIVAGYKEAAKLAAQYRKDYGYGEFRRLPRPGGEV